MKKRRRRSTPAADRKPRPPTCLQCRAGKMKCGGDGVQICAPCVKRYLPCVYPKQARARVLRASTSESSGLSTPCAPEDPSPSPSASPSPYYSLQSDSDSAISQEISTDSGMDNIGMGMDMVRIPQPTARLQLLPFPEEELPQLTTDDFNAYMSTWLRSPQHPRPIVSRALYVLSQHPLLVALQLWSGAVFSTGDRCGPQPASREQAVATSRLGRFVRSLLSTEVPRVLNQLSAITAASSHILDAESFPMTLENLVIVYVLTVLPNVLVKLGQLNTALALHTLALDILRAVGPRLSRIVAEQASKSVDDDLGLGQALMSSAQLAEYVVQQQWIRAAWTIAGCEL